MTMGQWLLGVATATNPGSTPTGTAFDLLTSIGVVYTPYSNLGANLEDMTFSTEVAENDFDADLPEVIFSSSIEEVETEVILSTQMEAKVG
jgi:hypothetical protein